MAISRPTAEQVRARRETTGRGMMECKREIDLETLRDAIEDANSFEDVRDILRVMLEYVH